MHSSYNIQWLTNGIEDGKLFKYIYFWGHNYKPGDVTGKFCLSQWFEAPFTVEGITYRTTEHWMMAQKALLFEDLKIFEKIIDAYKPAEAKELGRYVSGFDEQVWNDNKYEIVKTGNIHKFNQHEQLANYLLNTAERVLVEASPVDRIWGVGLAQDDEDIRNIYAWRGQNLLGFALMEVRDFLKDFGRFEPLNNMMLPPWRQYSHKHTADMFWRMGKGEEYLAAFYKYYYALNSRDKVIFRLMNPAHSAWKAFYD